MRRFLTSGRRRYALALLVIGAVVLTGCALTSEDADIEVDPQFAHFGDVPLGSSSAPVTFTVRIDFVHGLTGFDNIRPDPQVFSSNPHEEGQPFSVANNACAGVTLRLARDSCAFNVIYTPTKSGHQAGDLFVRDLTEGGFTLVHLTGKGEP